MISILKHALGVGEGSSKLGVLARGPPIPYLICFPLQEGVCELDSSLVWHVSLPQVWTDTHFSSTFWNITKPHQYTNTRQGFSNNTQEHGPTMMLWFGRSEHDKQKKQITFLNREISYGGAPKFNVFFFWWWLSLISP